MRICLVNTFEDTGGAARACSRLKSGLAAAGADVSLVVRERATTDPAVIASGSRSGGYLRALFDYLPVKAYPHRISNNFSPARVPAPALKTILNLKPDLVHLHWIPQGGLAINSIQKIPCPIVWTLHDSWPFTGGCHLTGECSAFARNCGRCPSLGSRQDRDLSRKVWDRKRGSYPVERMTLIAPSQWMADRVKSSSLLGHCVTEVIPNGVDIDLYSPGDKRAARAKFGLPDDRSIILFGAKSALSDVNKGADLLWQVLERLSYKQRKSSLLVLFGDEREMKIPVADIEVVNLGQIYAESKLVELYQAADVFVVTSRQENLPNMISEAMACGLPCAAFAVGGISEQIDHRRTGCLAPPYDTQVLAAEVSWLLDQGGQGELSGRAREHAASHYARDLVARRHVELYRRLVRNNGVFNRLVDFNSGE